MEDHVKIECYGIYEIFSKRFEPFQNSCKIQSRFASKFYNSKCGEDLVLGEKGSCSISNYIQFCQVYLFLDKRKAVFCIFKLWSIWATLENRWILENCILGPASINSVAQPRLELAQGHANAQPARPTRPFSPARRAPESWRTLTAAEAERVATGTIPTPPPQ
jgi:hypothetical protein